MIWRGRRAAAAAGAITAVLALAGCWTAPGAGPERSGHNPYENRLTPANVASLQPDWTWQAEWTTPRAVLDPITSPGSVHASVGHKLVTVDPETGNERWRVVLYDAGTAAQIPISAGAATYDDGTVFVPVGVYRNFVPGSGTHSYDAATGADLGVVARSASELTVPRDGRLFGTFGEIVGTFQAVTGYFVTDRDDASKSWIAYLAAGGLPSTTPSSVAVGPDAFYFRDGSTLFRYPLTQPAGCVNPGGSTIQFCPPTWSQTFGAGLTRPVLTRDGTQVIVGDAGHLVALHPPSGASLWMGPLPTSDPPSAPPAVDDARVFVPSAGKLVVFGAHGCGPAACNPEWSGDTAGTVRDQPAVAGGVVYTATTTGLLRAFAADGCSAPTCAPLWEHDLGAQITGAPAVSNGRLFVGTVDGRLISFAPTN